MTRRVSVSVLLILMWSYCGPMAIAATSAPQKSIADRSVSWPTLEQCRRVFFLEDYNTRVVIIGATLLGCSAGLVGGFTLLRRRALMGDALSHATLPGIALAFIIVTLQGGDGKSLPVLHLGATISGFAGVASILLIRNLTRLKEDTALGIVLSVFFGAGISLLGIVQQMKTGHSAGLETFIYGKTASMSAADAWLIATAAVACCVVCVLMFKELKLLCFDEGFAGSEGYPVILLDLVLMSLVVVTSIVGLQAVGLVLMIALLVIPAAAARFWTESMGKMSLISAGLGALGGMLGAIISALFSKLPSGAMIVLVCAFCFLISMMLGTRRGVLIRWLRRSKLNRTIDHQHLLRAMYELLELRQRPTLTSSATGGRSARHLSPGLNAADTDIVASVGEPEEISSLIGVSDLLNVRSWSKRRLERQIGRAVREGLVIQLGSEIRLTRSGYAEAGRLTHQHRLWELYLITHADVAPGRVDQDADAIEHVLEADVVAELESILELRKHSIADSPHGLELPESGASAVTAVSGGES